MQTMPREEPITIASQAVSSSAGVLIFPAFATSPIPMFSPSVLKARMALAESAEHELEDVLAELGL